MAHRKFVVVLSLATALVVACAAPTLAPSPTPTVPARLTLIEESVNGKSITIQTGAKLQLALHSTYWQIQGSSDSNILRPLGDPIIAPDPTVRIPGMGAGTVSIEFLALAPGRADIAASRTACGEAMPCAPAQASFKVTVTVR